MDGPMDGWMDGCACFRFRTVFGLGFDGIAVMDCLRKSLGDYNDYNGIKRVYVFILCSVCCPFG
jgi:hypothetical protein